MGWEPAQVRLLRFAPDGLVVGLRASLVRFAAWEDLGEAKGSSASMWAPHLPVTNGDISGKQAMDSAETAPQSRQHVALTTGPKQIAVSNRDLRLTDGTRRQ
jgi:hypothetical protein